jgi:rhomboid protease GluP
MQPGYPEPAAPRPQPVRVSLEQTSSSTVTYAIMAVTGLVYLLQMLSQQLYGQDYAALFGMKINSAIYSGQYFRFFTPMFLHGSLLHIGFNMYALFIIGTRLERVMGHGRFTLLYFLSGFAGNVMSFLFQPVASLGASTAIFGILGAEGVFIYQNRRYIANAQGMLTNVVSLAIINLVLGFSGQIDNWGHIGGLIGGTMFAWFAGPKIGVIEDVYPPTLGDTRSRNDTIIATILVLAFFGSLATYKLVFVPPPPSASRAVGSLRLAQRLMIGETKLSVTTGAPDD